MSNPGINGEGELRGQLAKPGSPGKMAVKTECVFVHTSHRSFVSKRINKILLHYLVGEWVYFWAIPPSQNFTWRRPSVSIFVTQMLTHDLNLVANLLVTSAKVGSSIFLRSHFSLCLSVGRITQKVVDEFWWNF